MIFPIDGSFLDLIDGLNILCIQNSEAENLPADDYVIGRFGQLSPATVHSADWRFDTRVKWWMHVSFIVAYLRQNSFLLGWNICKQCSESSTLCCFWSTVKKHGTHFERNFLIDKCSWKIVNVLPSDICKPSAISRNFNLGLTKTGLLWFLVFFGITAEFRRPKRSASFASVRPRLK